MKYKTFKPYDFQQLVIDRVEDNDINAYALFMGLGSGKTKTVIEIWRAKCTKEQRALKTLVITPLAVMTGFCREFFINSYIDESAVQLLDGTTKKDGKKLKNPTKKLRMEQLQNKDAQVLILNTDNVSNQDVWDIILELGIEFLIVDESHKFKPRTGNVQKIYISYLDKLSVSINLY